MRENAMNLIQWMQGMMLMEYVSIYIPIVHGETQLQPDKSIIQRRDNNAQHHIQNKSNDVKFKQ